MITIGAGGDKYHLQYRIQEWPPEWGNNLEILIFGDFNPPSSEWHFKSLRITIYPGQIADHLIKSAMYVIKAKVEVSEKSIAGLVDAAHRINVLLGAWSLEEWGAAARGWWSQITHGYPYFGGASVIDHHDLYSPIDAILKLPEPVRKKVDAALYWVREPRNLVMETHRSDLLRVYAGYWNAFECLVEAINTHSPKKKSSQKEKRRLINEFISQRADKLTAEDIQYCYRNFVDPGFRRKATHALRICFPNEAEAYISECFEGNEKLYQIRNDINHGNVDAEDPNELLRIESRLLVLWRIVLRMFSYFIPFSPPSELSPVVKKRDSHASGSNTST